MSLRPCLASICACLAAGVLLGAPASQLTVDVVPHTTGRWLAHPRSVVALHGDLRVEANVVPHGDLFVGTLHLPALGSWTVSCAGEREWCPARVVEVGDGSTTASLPVWPTYRLRIRLSGPGKETGRRSCSLQVNLLGPSTERPEQSLERHLELTDDGVLEDDLPRAPLDLRIAVEGACPLYLWDVQPPAGEVLELGERRLQAGSSLAGFVVDGDTGAPVAGAHVMLSPPGPGGGSMADVERSHLRARRTVSDPQGFFQVQGVEAGAYRVTVAAPDHPPWSTLTDLPAEQEVMLGEVRLERWASLDVDIQPPSAQDGQPWTVAAVPEQGEGREASTSPQGHARFDRLAPGPYTLLVRFPEGEQAAVRGVEVRGATALTIDLPLVTVRGTVTVGDEPAAGRVTLLWGTTKRAFQSDSEGRFEGFLPDPGKAGLGARFAGGGCTFEVGPLETRHRDGVLEAEVHIPDLRVAGRVVDATGAPVAGATVRAQGRGRTVSEATTDTDGRFEIRCLQPPSVWLEATAGDHLASGMTEVVPGDDISRPDVELVLHEKRPFKGVIVRGGVGVPGARVVVSCAGSIFPPWSTTGADGSFQVDLARPLFQVVLTVQVPGALLWSGRVPVPEDHSSVTVELPAEPPGTLVLVNLEEAEPPAPGARLWLLTPWGGQLARGELLSWALSGRWGGPLFDAFSRGELPERLEVPGVAPGTMTLAWIVGHPCMGGTLHGSTTGTLSPGGTLELEAP